jgi:hypothetical protein
MAISYVTATRNNMLANITSAIGTSGRLRIYAGTPPANANTALAGPNVILADLALSSTFAPAPSTPGLLQANAITAANASNTGTATFFRLTTSAGAAVVQGTVGTSGADLNLDSTSITSGVSVAVTSFTITEGNP